MNLTNDLSTARREVIDIDFPLHPGTQSSEAVSRLVGQILEQIQSQPEPVGDSDILQALAIATAVRIAVANANRKLGVELAIELLDVAADAIPPARLDG
ncbi:MAG: hypothetical protein PVF91_08750 [Chromatiales bacterium]